MKPRRNRLARVARRWTVAGAAVLAMAGSLLVGAKAAQAGGVPAIVCSAGDWSGTCTEITKSVPNVGSLPVGNDAISSLRVGSDEIIIYEDENYEGLCEAFPFGTSDEFLIDNWVYNDKVSSIWVNDASGVGERKTCTDVMTYEDVQRMENGEADLVMGPRTVLGVYGCADAHEDKCWYHTVHEEKEWLNKPVRGTNPLNNCIPGTTTSLTKSHTESVTLGSTFTSTHDETLTIGGGATATSPGGIFGKDNSAIPTAALNFSIAKTWHDGTSTSWVDTKTVSGTNSMTVPPGKIGWLEFYPYVYMTKGYMKADLGGWNGFDPARIYYYPEEWSDGLRSMSPVLNSDGEPVGYWKPAYENCKYEVKGEGSSKLMEVENGSKDNHAQVQIMYRKSDVQKRLGQQWTFVPTATNNTFQIVNNNSNKCLDVANPDSGENRVIQYTCRSTDNANQRWRYKVAGTGWTIVSAMNDKCLEVFGGYENDGADVGVWTCNGGDHQKWIFTNLDPR
ncbi:RICIN domain-containing protein [Streptomyces sp. NPDC085932]|uniref:RICIN domain-containing protein n=1 Tax=Streptomyces sp. NPDC085932 TaxID=3365741 RepID=UPI0037D84AE0